MATLFHRGDEVPTGAIPAQLFAPGAILAQLFAPGAIPAQLFALGRKYLRNYLCRRNLSTKVLCCFLGMYKSDLRQTRGVCVPTVKQYVTSVWRDSDVAERLTNPNPIMVDCAIGCPES